MKIKSLLLLLVFIGCASSQDALIDDLKFLIDSGDFDAAVLKADANMPAASDTSAEALEIRRLTATAYFGQTKLTLLDITSDVAAFGDDGNDNDFFEFACIVGSLQGTRFNSLHAAISRLSDLGDGVLDEAGNEALAFQAGILELIEAFGLSTNHGATVNDTLVEGKKVEPCAKDKFTVSAATLANLTDEDAANVLNSFVAADNHLRNSGLKEDEVILKVVRENYCRLKVQDGESGFRAIDLRAQVLCQISTTTNPDTSVLGAGTPACVDFIASGGRSSAISSCSGSDTDL